MKILLVEDSLPIRRDHESALHKAGYEVICVEDGESAVRSAEERQPDLILLDLILPKMSGPEVLQKLKRNAKTAEIPVIVVSSLSEKNRQKLIEAGAEDYLEKGEIMPRRGVNLLPNKLEDVVCRINRKRGSGLTSA